MDPREAYLQEQQEYLDRRDGERQDTLERTVVSRILRAFEVPAASVRRAMGDNYTLDWLWSQHPDAPVKLIARHVYKWSLTDLFLRPTKTPIYDAFEDAVDCHEGAVGAVFHANVLGDMVIHNWDCRKLGARIVIPTAEYGPLTVYRLGELLSRLAAEWTPTGFPLGDV